ncbi:hypothetical protein NQZ68_001391 [Dissostichus eleginoides]|nr:hypothetical protein NQZ68_001391 [Dissostichus eleginoides]
MADSPGDFCGNGGSSTFSEMDAILNTLKQFRLESYCNQLVQLGVKETRDFLDSVTDEDLDNMGEMNFNLKSKTVKHAADTR